MTKYYRVRSQEQWEWLANKLNIYCVKSMGCPVIIEHEQGRKYYNVFQYYGGFEPVIEVSQLMEDEKMENEDYVTIKDEDLEKVYWETNYGHTSFINHDENGEKYAHEQYLPANLSIPKSLLQQQKVKMTQAEKDEFDKLKDEMSLDRHDLDDLLTRIKDSEDFPLLYHRLYVADGDGVESQLEFARAWADESLIEVIPEKKWEVKVPCAPDHYYFKDTDNELIVSYASDGTESRKQFTSKELKQYGLDNDLFEKVEVSE